MDTAIDQQQLWNLYSQLSPEMQERILYFIGLLRKEEEGVQSFEDKPDPELEEFLLERLAYIKKHPDRVRASEIVEEEIQREYGFKI